MPADHLTTTCATNAPGELAAAVLAVLAGTDPGSVAASRALDPADLEDAVQTYQAAGFAALERQADNTWYQVLVKFPDWSAAEAVGATRLGPALDRLRTDGALASWWFLRKHPCWRLRLRYADTAAVNGVLGELTDAGVIERWWPTVYEPETAAFGGPAGMDTVHDLFCADSAGVLDYLRQDAPVLGRRELSILLLSGLMRSAGLDRFECGDVFDRVAQLRPTPAGTDPERISKLASDVRVLLSISDPARDGLFTPGGSFPYAAPWHTALRTAGERLGRDSADGSLERGLRAILAHVVIFHWNRFGLSATNQSVFARAATTALLPPG